jgi:hypothetical protein
MYTVNDFARIKRAGFHYSLPQETVEILQRLATLVGAEMPMLTKSSRPEKQGMDKLLADIKSGLNKLSDDTFHEIVPGLLMNLKQLEPSVAATLVMETATNNKFYACLYAKVLVQCNDADLLAQRMVAHEEAVLSGDTTCRAFTTFLSHMVLEGGVSVAAITSMVEKMQNKLEDGSTNVAAKQLNEELSEHVMELVEWLPKIRVEAMTCRLPKDFPGITFKVYFKYLDYHEKKHSEKK